MSWEASRRDLLIGCAAVAGSVALGATGGFRASRPVPRAFLFDARYEDALRFARLCETLGTSPTPLAPDVISQARRLFFRSRDGLDSPTGVAGLTGYADFTLLSDVARGFGHDVMFHAYHTVESATQVRHRVVVESRKASATPLELSGRAQWEERLAQSLFGTARSPLVGDTSRFGITLHSWVLAPRNS